MTTPSVFEFYETLRPRERRAVRETLIDANRLCCNSDELSKALDDAWLRVLFDHANAKLLACVGHKPLHPKLTEPLLALGGIPPEFAERLTRGEVREKGYSFNAWNRDTFKALNQECLDDLTSRGYGLGAVFSLIRQGNLTSRGLARRNGFRPIGTIDSPWSNNKLEVYLLGGGK